MSKVVKLQLSQIRVFNAPELVRLIEFRGQVLMFTLAKLGRFERSNLSIVTLVKVMSAIPKLRLIASMSTFSRRIDVKTVF